MLRLPLTKRPTRALVLRLLLLLTLFTPLSGCATNDKSASSPERTVEVKRPDRVAGEYIVRLRDNATGEQVLSNELDRFNISTIKQVSPGVFLIRFATDPGLESLQSVLANSKIVEAVQPNQRFYSK